MQPSERRVLFGSRPGGQAGQGFYDRRANGHLTAGLTSGKQCCGVGKGTSMSSTSRKRLGHFVASICILTMTLASDRRTGAQLGWAVCSLGTARDEARPVSLHISIVLAG